MSGGILHHVIRWNESFTERVVRCYYLDQPLSRAELSSVRETVAYRESVEADEIELKQVQVPSVWPAMSPGQYNEPRESERHTQLVRRNLQNAGIRQDVGRQVVWVMPKETYWGVVFQLAIFEETGFYPYTVQRWSMKGSRIVRGPLRVIDGHGMMGGRD